MSRVALVMAGGTGGHVFPGLAVAAVLRARGWDVVWLGNPAGMEAGLVAKAGLPFEGVSFGALRGKGALAVLGLPMAIARGVSQAKAVLQRVRPQVVLGMGGYVTFPGGVGARMLGIPLVLHEQNSTAGLANRVLARIADRVVEAFPGAFRTRGGGRVAALVAPPPQDRVSVLGNPVRAALAALPDPAARAAARRGPLRVLVVGGSLGARALNDAMPAALAIVARSLAPADRPVVVHQSGRANIDALRDAYAGAGVDANLVDFIDDMPAAYADADLVICRAGAMTVAELAASGVASLLVPYPHAVDDHQTGNARWLADRDAAWLQPQAMLDADTLAARLLALATPARGGVPAGRAELAAMAARARAAALPDAAERVADLLESIARPGASSPTAPHPAAGAPVSRQDSRA